MDELEESYDDANMGQTSTNMDDTGACVAVVYSNYCTLKDRTGFFSVQVLERALNVWGLACVSTLCSPGRHLIASKSYPVAQRRYATIPGSPPVRYYS